VLGLCPGGQQHEQGEVGKQREGAFDASVAAELVGICTIYSTEKVLHICSIPTSGKKVRQEYATDASQAIQQEKSHRATGLFHIIPCLSTVNEK